MRALFIGIAVGLCGGGALAGDVDPRGLYFHEFTGSVSGSEWSTWGEINGFRRYEFSDLTAAGRYQATVQLNGQFTLDNGVGNGQFRDNGTHFIDFNFGNFHSELRRAPYTDENFPVFLASIAQGDTGLSDEWSARILDVDPLTGATLGETNETVDVLVSGSTVRMTLDDGTFFQSVWVDGEQAALRVIEPRPTVARYRTFHGNETSLDQNVLGEVRVIDDRSMTMSVFMQTRAGLGSQVQTMRYMELTRVPSPGAVVVFGAGGLMAARRRRRPVDQS